MQLFVAWIIVVILISVAWRVASRRQTIPCPVWLAWLVEMDNPFTKTNRATTIVNYLNIKPGMRVLDFGCGPGRLTIPLAKAVGENGKVIAVDIQAGMLSRAKQKAQIAQLNNIQFLQAAAGEGKLGRERFDRAVLVTVLGEIPDRKVVLKEIYDALIPGGILSVTEIIFDPHFQRRHTVVRLASDVGYQEKMFFGNSIAYTLHLQKPTARE